MDSFMVGFLFVSYVVWCLVHWMRGDKPKTGRRMKAPVQHVQHVQHAHKGAYPYAPSPTAIKAEEKKVALRPHIIYNGAPREVLRRRRFGDAVECVLRPDTAGACRPCVVVSKDDIEWLPKS